MPRLMVEAVDRGTDTPSEKAVVKALARLAQKSLELFWVRDEARELFRLTCVRERAEKDFKGKEDALPLALIAVLRDLVESFEPIQYRKLLWIVYDFDGDHPETTAQHRRTIAGTMFRDGKRPVGAGAIRKYHEPKAREKLAKQLLALEQ